MDLLAGLHDDYDWEALEARDEVEGAFPGGWVEALRRVRADGESVRDFDFAADEPVAGGDGVE
jgi:hypothetical protein